MKTSSVMIVEDEAIVALNLKRRLEQLGYEVTGIADSGDDALALMHARPADLVLMDIHIKGAVDGIDAAGALAQKRSVPVIFLTAYSEDATLMRARTTRPYGYLLKPFSERELHATIQMALARFETERALSLSEARLRLAMESADLGVIELAGSDERVNVSDRAAHILGLDASANGVCLNDVLEHVEPPERERVGEALKDAMRAIGRAAVEFQVAGDRADARWARLVARWLNGNQGDAGRLIGVVQDVTEQHRAWDRIETLNNELEATVARRTAELREALTDLDAFNYSVAHDLRAPVRAVLSFSAIALEDHGSAMPEAARSILMRIKASGERMGDLIDGLLKLARINRAPLMRTRFDLSALAEEVLAELRQTEPGRVVGCHIEPGLLVSADRQLVRVVLTNLLANAWKFTSRHAEANIWVGGELRDGIAEFYVRDDGAGFSTEASSNLFNLFHRLHSASEFDGIGVGLVTVQRIVQRHGGRISGEGFPERGATFRFTLG